VIFVLFESVAVKIEQFSRVSSFAKHDVVSSIG